MLAWRPWPYQSIGEWETSPLADLLVVAAGAYTHPQYRDVAIQIDGDEALSSSLNLLFPDYPDL